MQYSLACSDQFIIQIQIQVIWFKMETLGSESFVPMNKNRKALWNTYQGIKFEKSILSLISYKH